MVTTKEPIKQWLTFFQKEVIPSDWQKSTRLVIVWLKEANNGGVTTTGVHDNVYIGLILPIKSLYEQSLSTAIV